MAPISLWSAFRSLFVILALFFSTARASLSSPTPISVPAQTNWLGYDGQWSASTLRIGTPPQWVALLPSTSGQETWVIGTKGCDGSEICRTKRGGLFEANISSTWQDVGGYQLGLDTQLGFTGAGTYGFDNIAISDSLSVKDQIVSIVNDTQYWLGYVGLGIKGTNFTQENKPTFLSSLSASQELSPSYGYTAGASYRLKKVLSSLTLGGYDRNRLIPNDLTFSLDSNQQPVVAINKISVSATSKSSNISKTWAADTPAILLDTADADLFTIDSSTPYLWLPANVCKNFEQALGLTYNDTLRLYTYNSTAQHNLLKSSGISFNFTLGDLPGSKNAISLSVPFDAGDLSLSYGFPGLNMTATSSDVPYFPLRKAANSTQYTIGRMFLQETYLIVDYQRNNFSISQAQFGSNAVQNISLVAIPPPANITITTEGNKNKNSGLATGVLIGIAIAATVCVVGLIVLIACYILRRRYAREAESKEQHTPKNAFSRWLRKLYRVDQKPSELDSAHGPAYEFPPDSDLKELPDSPAPTSELPSPGKYVIDQKYNVSTPTGHNPQIPVELPADTHLPDAYQLSGDLTPETQLSAYSPDDVGRVSQRSTNFTPTSGPSSYRSTMVLSPLTPDYQATHHLGMPSPLTPEFQRNYELSMPSPLTSYYQGGSGSGETTWSSIDQHLAPPSAISSERSGPSEEADLPAVPPLQIRRSSPQTRETRPKRFSWESE